MDLYMWGIMGPNYDFIWWELDIASYRMTWGII